MAGVFGVVNGLIFIVVQIGIQVENVIYLLYTYYIVQGREIWSIWGISELGCLAAHIFYFNITLDEINLLILRTNWNLGIY